MSHEAVRAAVEATIARLRAELVERHGWTCVEISVRLEAEAEARRIALHGEVAVDRLAGRVVEAVRLVAPGWIVEDEGVQAMRGGSWHELAGAGVLLAERPGSVSPRRVATELRAQDGPVQRLGEAGGAIVARGCDGTVGWLEGTVGPEVEAPRLQPPHGDDPFALVRAARPWLDVPYRLGGVTEQGVDCSGLVQRLALEVLGVLLPRHSSDQLLVAPRPGPGRAPGDLSFVWSDREAARIGGSRRPNASCHVGIGTGDTVIHASLSRGCVVEDRLEAFLADTRGTMHVPFAELLAFGRQLAGSPSLVTAGFRLGRGAPGSLPPDSRSA